MIEEPRRLREQARGMADWIGVDVSKPRWKQLMAIGESPDERVMRQDPIVRYLMDAVGDDSQLLASALRDLYRIKRLDIPVTESLIDKIVGVSRGIQDRYPANQPDPVEYEADYVGSVGRGELVYYMRIGNRVKIGTTINIKSRLLSINPEELMATEPGGRTLETHRHRQFAALRTNGEWFKLEDPLVAHIEDLRQVA